MADDRCSCFAGGDADHDFFAGNSSKWKVSEESS